MLEEKVYHNQEYTIRELYDNKKKYNFIYDKDNYLLRAEERNDQYNLSIDSEEITLYLKNEKINSVFKYSEIYKRKPQNNYDTILTLSKQFGNINLFHPYRDIEKVQMTDTEANNLLMNYVHFMRKMKSTNFQINEEENWWLDLKADVGSIYRLIKQYEIISQNNNKIYTLLTKLEDENLKALKKIFALKTNDFSKKRLLQSVGWKLSGAAAEKIVDFELNKIQDFNSLANVILPFDYGSKNATNQIDNVVITSCGIFCIEIKSKEIVDGLYNFNREDDQREFVVQTINHKRAVKKILLDNGIFIPSKYIYPVLLIMNRKADKRGQNFRIVSDLRHFDVINLNQLQSLGNNKDSILTANQVQEIIHVLKVNQVEETKYDHYSFLPSLEKNSTAIVNFWNELGKLRTLLEKMEQNLEIYYRNKNYHNLMQIIKSSYAFQSFQEVRNKE